jgi:predicted metal-dependent peptidase
MPTLEEEKVLADARLRIMAARIIAQSRWPYISTLLFSLKMVATQQIETMAVDDGWRMYYSPAFVMEHEPDILATAVLHEVLHCVMQHGPRFRSLNQHEQLHPNWNIAGDAGINETLDEARMEWGSFTPVRFQQLLKYGVQPTMTTEQIFFQIMAHLEKHPEDGTPIQDCGSVMGGGARPYELPRNHSDNGAVKSDQQDVIRDRVAQDILNYNRDKNAGSIPGNLLRWAQDLLEPKVDWRKALAGNFRSALATLTGRRDYVYTRPSRRQSAMRVGTTEIILPAMRKPAPPSVAVIIDTSGSISEKDVELFLSEVDGIARANGIAQGLTIIPCDAEVGPIQKLRSRGAITELQLPGGGGTDMGRGIAAAAELKPIPKIVIVLTDGYTPWPAEPPAKVESVIVCLTVPHEVEQVPAWAKTILIEDN